MLNTRNCLRLASSLRSAFDNWAPPKIKICALDRPGKFGNWSAFSPVASSAKGTAGTGSACNLRQLHPLGGAETRHSCHALGPLRKEVEGTKVVGPRPAELGARVFPSSDYFWINAARVLASSRLE